MLSGRFYVNTRLISIVSQPIEVDVVFVVIVAVVVLIVVVLVDHRSLSLKFGPY